MWSAAGLAGRHQLRQRPQRRDHLNASLRAPPRDHRGQHVDERPHGGVPVGQRGPPLRVPVVPLSRALRQELGHRLHRRRQVLPRHDPLDRRHHLRQRDGLAPRLAACPARPTTPPPSGPPRCAASGASSASPCRPAGPPPTAASSTSAGRTAAARRPPRKPPAPAPSPPASRPSAPPSSPRSWRLGVHPVGGQLGQLHRRHPRQVHRARAQPQHVRRPVQRLGHPRSR